jgi:hypothetical protein
VLATMTGGESFLLKEEIHGFEAGHDGSSSRGNTTFPELPTHTHARQRTRPVSMIFPFNPFRIDWNDCTFGQWDTLLACCKRSTLLQTWQYGVALAKNTATPAWTWAASTKRRRASPGSRPAWEGSRFGWSEAMSDFP